MTIIYQVNGKHRDTRQEMMRLVYDLAFYGMVHVRPGARGPSFIEFECDETRIHDFQDDMDFEDYNLDIEVVNA